MPSGLVRIELRRPFADGTVAVEMDPLSLLCRLAAAVPSPRRHTVRYSGVLAPASKWRPLVVPAPPPEKGSDGLATDLPAAATATATTSADDLAHPAATRSSALTTQAPHPRAIVTRPKSVRRILQLLGEPTDPPARAPARSPPFFQTGPLRRRLRHASAQMPMFEG